MAKQRPSLGNSSDQEVLGTLQDVLDRLLTIERLSPGRRGDLRCAVNKMAKAIGQSAEEVPVNLGYLQQQLDGFVPAAYGMTAKRWSTIKADFQSALRLTGFADPLRTSNATLSPAWSAVLDSTLHRHHRTGLSRFARYCSMHGIAPEAVDDGVFGKFGDALKRRSLVRKPGAVLRMTAFAWNAMCNNRPDFPGRPLPVPSNRPKSRRVVLSDLPASFLNDVDDYCAWCAIADPLDDDARARAKRPRTIKLNRELIRSAVTAAVEKGVPTESIANLAKLVEPEPFKHILRRRHEMAGEKANATAQGIATLLISIAKEWVKLPLEKVEELKRLRSKLPRLKTGLVAKNQRLLDQFEDPALEARYLHLPDELWREARSGKLKPYKALVRAQLALAMIIEQILGLRSLNLSNLSFSRHLSWPAGPKGLVLLRIDGQEMKAGIEYKAELPPEFGQTLLYYRDRIVPAATGKHCDAVFVTRGGLPKKQHTLAKQFRDIVRQRLGITMSLHQNRHLGAMRMMDDNVGAIETARQWLGHQNLKTTVNSYGGVNTRRAVRHHAALIERRRESTRHLLKRRPRTPMKSGPRSKPPSKPTNGK